MSDITDTIKMCKHIAYAHKNTITRLELEWREIDYRTWYGIKTKKYVPLLVIDFDPNTDKKSES